VDVDWASKKSRGTNRGSMFTPTGSPVSNRNKKKGKGMKEKKKFAEEGRRSGDF